MESPSSTTGLSKRKVAKLRANCFLPAVCLAEAGLSVWQQSVGNILTEDFFRKSLYVLQLTFEGLRGD